MLLGSWKIATDIASFGCAAARGNRDVLLAAHRETHGWSCDHTTRIKGPKLIARFGVQCKDVTFEVAGENQIASGGQQRRVVVIPSVEWLLFFPG